MFILRQALYFYQMASLRQYIAACMMTAWAAGLPAQLLHLPYRHYTVHDGLAQQQVMCMMQDSRGYIWAGAKAGVSRFNGQYFENFRPAQGAPGNYIARLAEDYQGRIWASSYEGLGYYDGVEWRKVSDKGGAELILPAPEAALLFYYPQEHTLWRLSGDTLAFADSITLQHVSRGRRYPPGARPGHWAIYSDGPDTYTLIKIDAEGEVADAIELNRKRYFQPVPAGQGQIYLASQPDSEGVVYISRPGEGQPLDSVRFNLKMDGFRITSLLRSRHGGLYLALDFKQVFCKVPGKLDAERLDIPISNATGLMAGREGAVWMHGEDGLYQYFPQGFKYISSRDAPTAWGFGEDDAGNYWISSFGHGLKRIHQGKLSSFPSPQGIPNPDNFYFGLSQDHLGNLYFSHERGLFRFRQGHFDRILQQNPFSADNSSAILYNFFDTLDRKVIAGMKEGVVIYDPATGRPEPVHLEAINGANVLGITRDDNGNYWFTSSRRGIVKYHIPTKTISSFHKGEEGVPLSGAICVENGPGPGPGLWFGSFEGLFYFSGETQEFRRIAESIIPGPVNNLKVVDSLLMIGSLSGLHALHLPSFYRKGKEWLKAYNPNNGFLGIEPDQNGAFLDSRGNYWVLCFNQIATIPKEDINMEDYPSRVRIFQINGQRVPYAASEPIVLPRGENQITIRFESIGFQRPLRTQYSWRLLGYSEAWSAWAEDQIAFFPQLPSGEYAFEVRSRHPGSLDVASHITDSYRFQVRLPFFKEPHFYKFAFIIGFLLFALSGIGIGFYWNARRDARKARLAATEREQMMKYYQIQTLQSQLQPHFIFNLLNAIKSFIVRGRQEEAEEHIERLSKVMRRFLESSVGAGLENLGQQGQEITLQSEIELLRYYAELMQVLKPGKFTFHIEVEPSIHPANVVIAPMIIQPFVENAIKHGLAPKKDGPGHLLLRFSRNEDGLLCMVQDNGPGFPFGRPPAPDKGLGHRPMGIGLVMNRVELLRNFGIMINIRFESPPQGGARVHILFAE